MVQVGRTYADTSTNANTNTNDNRNDNADTDHNTSINADRSRNRRRNRDETRRVNDARDDHSRRRANANTCTNIALTSDFASATTPDLTTTNTNHRDNANAMRDARTRRRANRLR